MELRKKMLIEEYEGELTWIQKKILKALKEYGPSKRGQEKHQPDALTGYTNLPRTTIIDNLEKLERKELVERFEKHNGKRGRPPVYWKLKNKEEDD